MGCGASANAKYKETDGTSQDAPTAQVEPAKTPAAAKVTEPAETAPAATFVVEPTPEPAAGVPPVAQPASPAVTDEQPVPATPAVAEEQPVPATPAVAEEQPVPATQATEAAPGGDAGANGEAVASEARAAGGPLLPSLDLPEQMGGTKSVQAAPRHSREEVEAADMEPKSVVTDAELEALYREYTGAAEAGFTPESFLAIVRKLDPEGYHSDSEVMRLFDEIDLDSSGNLDLEEFIDWTRHELEGEDFLKKMRSYLIKSGAAPRQDAKESVAAA